MFGVVDPYKLFRVKKFDNFKKKEKAYSRLKVGPGRNSNPEEEANYDCFIQRSFEMMTDPELEEAFDNGGWDEVNRIKSRRDETEKIRPSGEDVNRDDNQESMTSAENLSVQDVLPVVPVERIAIGAGTATSGVEITSQVEVQITDRDGDLKAGGNGGAPILPKVAKDVSGEGKTSSGDANDDPSLIATDSHLGRNADSHVDAATSSRPNLSDVDDDNRMRTDANERRAGNVEVSGEETITTNLSTKNDEIGGGVVLASSGENPSTTISMKAGSLVLSGNYKNCVDSETQTEGVVSDYYSGRKVQELQDELKLVRKLLDSERAKREKSGAELLKLKDKLNSEKQKGNSMKRRVILDDSEEEDESKKDDPEMPPFKKQKHVCPTCGESFCRSTILRRHIESVHEKKKFVCEKCGAQLSRGDVLKTHKCPPKKPE